MADAYHFAQGMRMLYAASFSALCERLHTTIYHDVYTQLLVALRHAPAAVIPSART